MMNKEQRYAVADKLATAYKDTFKNVSLYNKNYIFGIVINSKVDNKTLTESFGSEDAAHITNLTIRRLKSPDVKSVSINL